VPELEGAAIEVVIATIVVVAAIVEIPTTGSIVRVAILVIVTIVGVVELRFAASASIVISGV
jgi:hypothetical protein